MVHVGVVFIIEALGQHGLILASASFNILR